MKQILVVLATIGVAYAGVHILSSDESSKIIHQFENWCKSGKVPQTGLNIKGVQWYCKAGPGRQQEVTHHKVTVPIGKGLDQSVFVQAPHRDLTHVISIDGTGQGGATNVYVVPGTVDNKYQIKATGRVVASKPSIFYVQDGSESTHPVSPPHGDDHDGYY